MKLKEKLAMQSVPEQGYTSVEHIEYSGGFYDGYLAGFEKAREMAANMVKYHDMSYLEALMTVLGEEEV